MFILEIQQNKQLFNLVVVVLSKHISDGGRLTLIHCSSSPGLATITGSSLGIRRSLIKEATWLLGDESQTHVL